MSRTAEKTDLSTRPTSIDQIPLLMNPHDVALICGIAVKSVQNNPERFGLKKRAGMGLRVNRNVFLRKQGLLDLGSLK